MTAPTQDTPPSVAHALALTFLVGFGLVVSHATYAQPISEPLWSRAVAPADCYVEYVPQGGFLLDADNDVVINAGDGLERIAADGQTLWQVPPCPTCEPPAPNTSYLADVSLTGAPATWVVESRGNFLDPPLELAFLQLDHSGAVVGSTPFAPALKVARVKIIADASGVTALVAAYPHNGLPRFQWIRHTQGEPLIERELAVGVGSLGLSVNALWPSANGGVLAALEHQAFELCIPTYPCDTTPQLALVRFDARGNEQWRVEEDGFVPWPAVQPDGSAWLAHRSHGIAKVSPAGVLSPVMPVAGLQQDEVIFSIHGPVAGRVVLATNAGLRLVDLEGRLRASRLMGYLPFWEAHLATIPGYFVLPMLASDADCVVAQLLDPATLAVRRVLRNEIACPLHRFRLGDARVHADGSIYITGVVRGDDCDNNSDSGSELHLMRFGLPGTPAGGLLFRDDFGP